MASRIIALILAVAVGAGVGAFTAVRMVSDDSSSQVYSKSGAASLAERLALAEPDELDPAQVAQVVESLMQIVDEEISERQILADQLDEVRAEMADLQQNLRTRVEAAFSDNTGNAVTQAPDAQVDQSMEKRLASLGFTPQQFEDLRRREEGAQMQQIELNDRAIREGWVNSPRYFEELNKLTSGTDDIRLELGDDTYDRYLYASGRPNRIAVGTVIPTSPAEQAGFKTGDVIKSYGGERVFSSGQLVNLRSEGDIGAPVVVEIIRNGELMQITMPRGPMGVQTRPDRTDPFAPGGG